MSSFTINGQPAGYFIDVMRRHAELCAEAVESGIITPAEADEFRKAALESVRTAATKETGDD